MKMVRFFLLLAFCCAANFSGSVHANNPIKTAPGRININVPSAIMTATAIGAGIGVCAYGASIVLLKIREWIHQQKFEEPVSLKASLIGGALAGATVSCVLLHMVFN